MSKKLLHTPEGVRDVYGQEFLKKQQVMKQMQDKLHLFGYSDIETPTFEFFDVFSKEVGTTPSKELYKFFDKDNNTLVLRPDFTPSIARCVAKYFMEEAGAIRMCYQGSSFSNISSLQGKFCESTQMGAELIGDDSAKADAEQIALVIENLQAVGLENFRVSIGQVEYFKGLCEEAGLDVESEYELRSYISGKNIFAAAELLDETDIDASYKEKILAIANSFEDHSSLEGLKEAVHNSRSLNAIHRLEEVLKVLKLYGYEDYVSFDLGLLNKYNYYTGIIFRVYTYGVGQPIVKGGRYDNLLNHFGKDAPAVGFVILVDTLLEALNSQHIAINCENDITIVEYDSNDSEDFAKQLEIVKELRKNGKKVSLSPKQI